MFEYKRPRVYLVLVRFNQIFSHCIANDFVWKTKLLENDTRVEYRAEQSQGENAIHVPKSSAVKLHGFNVQCLTNPRACHGSFALKFVLSFTNKTDDGIIFSTTGYNTSVVGTSLFLEGSELVASVRTNSRAWNISSPIVKSVNTFQNITVKWSYTGDIVLDIDSNTRAEKYSIVTHSPGEHFDGVFNVGGIDMFLRMTSFKVQSYDLEWSKRIHYGG